MLNDTPVSELIEYKCADCGNDTWNIVIVQQIDGHILLLTICANQECVRAKQEDMKLDDSQMIIWDKFDITGQTDHGRDPADAN